MPKNAAEAELRLIGRVRAYRLHRAVLTLFAVEGLKHADIAEVLGIPEGTVWSRLHLARKRLLTLLAEDAAAAR